MTSIRLWLRRHAAFVRAAPSAAVSVAVHLLLLAAIAGIILIPRVVEREAIFSILEFNRPDPVPVEQPEPPAPEPLDEPEPDPIVKPVPAPAVEPAASKPEPEPRDPDPVKIATKGSSPSTGPPRKGIYSSRTGTARHAAIRQYGGNSKSEDAVKGALAWLARHQDRDGKWDVDGFDSHCPKHDKCTGLGHKTIDIDPGVTGLALLAFLARGNTQYSDGVYGTVIRRGLQYIASIQRRNGRFGPNNSLLMYNHGISTLAICEAYALTKDPSLRDIAQQGVNFIIDAQQHRGGGWDYTAQMTGRNDTSVTGWQVMALKSASAAGLRVPWPAVFRVVEHFDRMTLDSGEVIYSNKGVGDGRRGAGMVAVGMVCRQFLGWSNESRILSRQARILRKNMPDYSKINKPNQFQCYYYWYYGSIAMFQAGGSNWRVWNNHLRDLLISKQVRTGHAEGSWDPETRWLGEPGGRVYATAINALSLEIYYRYLPLHEASSNLSAAAALRQAMKAPSREMQATAARLLPEFKDQKTRTHLADALDHSDPIIRINAARALGADGDRKSLGVLHESLRHKEPYVRIKAIDAIAELKVARSVPYLIRALDDDQAFIARKIAALLRTMTGQAFDFNEKAPLAERRAAATRWLEWWNSQNLEQPFKAADSLADSKPALHAPESTTVTTNTSRVVSGTILDTRPDDSLVMLDIGRDKNIHEGDTFTVLRDGQYYGWIKVSKVFKDRSAALVIARHTVGELRQGDRVTANAHN